MTGAGQLAILVIGRAKPGCAEEATALITAQLERIRKNEPACVSIAAHRDGEDPDRLMLYELWTDRPSFEAFLERADMVEYLDGLDRLLESREITRWDLTG